jgi:hypothetical protein
VELTVLLACGAECATHVSRIGLPYVYVGRVVLAVAMPPKQVDPGVAKVAKDWRETVLGVINTKITEHRHNRNSPPQLIIAERLAVTLYNLLKKGNSRGNSGRGQGSGGGGKGQGSGGGGKGHGSGGGSRGHQSGGSGKGQGSGGGGGGDGPWKGGGGEGSGGGGGGAGPGGDERESDEADDEPDAELDGDLGVIHSYTVSITSPRSSVRSPVNYP